MLKCPKTGCGFVHDPESPCPAPALRYSRPPMFDVEEPPNVMDMTRVRDMIQADYIRREVQAMEDRARDEVNRMVKHHPSVVELTKRLDAVTTLQARHQKRMQNVERAVAGIRTQEVVSYDRNATYDRNVAAACAFATLILTIVNWGIALFL